MTHKVLEETDWNLKQAAKEMEIARGTLYSKMKKYGIEKPHLGANSTKLFLTEP